MSASTVQNDRQRTFESDRPPTSLTPRRGVPERCPTIPNEGVLHHWLKVHTHRIPLLHLRRSQNSGPGAFRNEDGTIITSSSVSRVSVPLHCVWGWQVPSLEFLKRLYKILTTYRAWTRRIRGGRWSKNPLILSRNWRKKGSREGMLGVVV